MEIGLIFSLLSALCFAGNIIFLRRGVVRAERKGGYWNILTRENPRLCLICGKPIPKGRNKYCSEEHYELAMHENRKRRMWRRFRKRWKSQDAGKWRRRPLREAIDCYQAGKGSLTLGNQRGKRWITAGSTSRLSQFSRLLPFWECQQ